MTSQSHRLASGGRIDRHEVLSFTVDGDELTGHPGDTVASALLANGRVEVAPSLYRNRRRGILAAGVEEPHALLQVEAPFAESMVSATVTPLVNGLICETLTGLGRLQSCGDDAVFDKQFVHTDVLVVGGGPAGLAAAVAAARSDARVILVDDQPELGGSLLSCSGEQVDGRPAMEWVAGAAAELSAAPEVTVLPRTTVVGDYDDNYLIAVQRRTAHLGRRAPAGVSRERLWHIRARRVIVATGAHERPIVFAGNDRPGVMLAGSVRSYLNRYAVRPGVRAAIFTNNDSAYDTAFDLLDAGVDLAAVVDARPSRSEMAATLAFRGVRVLTGSAVVATSGGPRLSSVTVSGLDVDGLLTGEAEDVACDVLAVSGGWSPVVHLHSQRQGDVRWDVHLAAFVPVGRVRGQVVAGAAGGVLDLDGCLSSGTSAGVEAAGESGYSVEAAAPEGRARTSSYGEIRALWLVPGLTGGPEEWHDHFVDLQRDQTVADVWQAVDAGMRSVEHVKRYTSIGTAHDQGKTSTVNAIGVLATALSGRSLGDIGTTTFRAPYTPVSFAALAGRERGALFDPVRTTPVHSWHVEHGAEFEVVGQWLRPWFYPQHGETAGSAVARECRAARNGVAMMDASTLGKIEIRGSDAGEFLNRIYTNAFAKLPVGSARYGVMCTPDGMIFDDGVTLRLSEDRFFMTTTTGGAAGVLDWLEEWLQTEWPHLDVACTSVTEQWTTIAVVGPLSGTVMARVAPELDVSNEAFGFMTFRETTLANGVPARVCRISFSGELAYEINVPGWYGLAVWEQVYAAGQDLNITPYGTDAMHVLRAEKGYPIVGQDTDGTVTPLDAGMERIVSKSKDFLGKRSLSRPDTARADRKQMVGLLTVDGSTRLPEGTQLVEQGTSIVPGSRPVPMLGHVTSSYHSDALDRPIALGLVVAGRRRIGEKVLAVTDRLVEVMVTDTVFYDPEGTRRDG